MRLATFAGACVVTIACAPTYGAADDPKTETDAAVDAGSNDAPAGDVAVVDGADGDVTRICPPGDCRVVFVTTAAFDGNLGGIAGADMKCQAAAMASSIADVRRRVFRAWLSVAGATAADVQTKDPKPYRRVDAAIVANGWNDLIDGTILVPINLDQNGTELGKVIVWTGTSLAGNLSLNNCLNWTQAGGGDATTGAGQVGRADQTNASWTDADVDFPPTPACETTAHLYCFEK